MPDEPKVKALSEIAINADWGQVAANGGPPCFHVENGHFCLRTKRWAGHCSDDHYYVGLDDMLRSVESENTRLKQAQKDTLFVHMDRLKQHEIINYDLGKKVEELEQQLVAEREARAEAIEQRDQMAALLTDDLRIQQLEKQLEEEQEALAQFMIRHSFATGHGDSHTDLLTELDGQVMQLRREIASARVCDCWHFELVDTPNGETERLAFDNNCPNHCTNGVRFDAKDSNVGLAHNS